MVSYLKSINIEEYAVMSNIAFNNRMNMYTSESVIKSDIIDISNAFYKKIGKTKSI